MGCGVRIREPVRKGSAQTNREREQTGGTSKQGGRTRGSKGKESKGGERVRGRANEAGAQVKRGNEGGNGGEMCEEGIG